MWDTSEAMEDKPPKLHIVLDSDSFSGSLSSPHKEVDDFVLTLVKKDGVEGSKLRSNLYIFNFYPVKGHHTVISDIMSTQRRSNWMCSHNKC